MRSLEFETAPFSKNTGFFALALSPDKKHIAGTNRSFAAVWSVEDGALCWKTDKFRGGNSLNFVDKGATVVQQRWFHDLQKANWKSEAPLSALSISGLRGHLVKALTAPEGSSVHMMVSALVREAASTGATAVTAVTADGEDLEVETEETWNGELGQREEPGAQAEVETGVLMGLDLTSGKVAWQAKSAGRIHDFAFLPDGQHVLSAGSRGCVELWKIGNAAPVQSLDLSRSPLLRGVGATLPDDGLVSALPYLEEDAYCPHTLHTMSLSADGKQLALGTVAGAVLVVELI